MNTTRHRRDTHSPSRDWQTISKGVGAVALVVALTTIALLAASEAVYDAPADSPIVQAAFDMAPPVDASDPLQHPRVERWAADQSAPGARSDSLH